MTSKLTSNPSGYQSDQSEEINGRCTLIITPEAHGSGDFFLGALSVAELNSPRVAPVDVAITASAGCWLRANFSRGFC
ncbi:hypothetical protein BJP36_39845 [Moorena producens JHB]|uniref:Uncharacterized protein n=1 Tax=Moorena producens (strain JHB) TaxID=1454205 RepID=A0A9Q9SV54_MOOP1|nr:hypothetical protein [Moorena producens]WAN70210.1 hypothetical protein BJP36_39845 [Moorena producens JHB]